MAEMRIDCNCSTNVVRGRVWLHLDYVNRALLEKLRIFARSEGFSTFHVIGNGKMCLFVKEKRIYFVKERKTIS